MALQKIPQRGFVTDGVTYELHGVGCSVYLSEICVDFDYGPDERVDGFDHGDFICMRAKYHADTKIHRQGLIGA